MVWFSFIAGVLAGCTVTLIAARLVRGAAPRPPTRLPVMSCLFVTAAALIAALLYVALGALHPPQRQSAVATTQGPAAAPAQSMRASVAKLEARLAGGGGTEADWTLLAQAYDFLGRPADAQRARAHLATPDVAPLGEMSSAALVATAAELDRAAAASVPAAASPLPVGNRMPAGTRPSARSRADLEQRVHSHPGDAQGWLALADDYRTHHDNVSARGAYAHVIELNAMSAQSWADYADVEGSLAGGSLGGEAGRAIDHALALDGTNPKALWLKASQAHEQRRYSEALSWWQQLRAVLPADSPDAQIVDNNIAEAVALAGGAPVAATGAAAQPERADTAEVSGTVALDARFANRVPRDATLFICARAVDAPGPPLAVWRTRANTWPVAFRLDDSMAMLPSRRLSQFTRVVVEARISRSGQATPAPGDLYVTSDVLRPAAAQKLALVINREIG
jgi:cytochrome c-type biogenesis protein CcmH